ncbi:MAG: ABC transporter ATP-binding protein [Chloroflexota bacterium]|nr:MAG: ABC transporter ATP-binding protein [Chloroflexota bacterium]
MAQQQTFPLILNTENLTKIFPHVVANDNISFEVRKGEVHCLLGENGAGKSTLAKCIYGASKPDSGHLYFKGELVHLSSPHDAINIGVGMVHQHFVLAAPMTAIENIVVGVESSGIKLDLFTATKRLKSICDKYNVDLNLNARISELSVSQQQWVEILKALYVGVDLLILDEPTAVLTPQETDKLFTILKEMTTNGLSIILITHKLYEVMSISDRVTVLRKGKKITTLNTSDTNKAELARLMVGRDIDFRVQKEAIEPGEVVLQLEGVKTLKDNRQVALNKFNLSVRRNQILGLAGVGGNGQKELFDVIIGVREALEGQILLNGQNVTTHTPAERIGEGLGSIPPDRIYEGLLMDFNIGENMILGLHRNNTFRSGSLLSFRKINKFARQMISEFSIAASSPGQITKTLSGGNLQKIILARELSQKPQCIIASSPTRGLDVGAMEFVYRRLVELRRNNVGILLISEDLDEIFNVSDRVAVIFKGQIMGIFDVNETNKEQVGLLMAGIQDGAL